MLQGEDQKKLDIVSNEVFCNALRNSGKTGVIASEEEDLPVAVEETYSGICVCNAHTLVSQVTNHQHQGVLQCSVH